MNLWVDKYKPRTIDDIIGNSNKIKLIEKWMKEFSDPDSKKILLLTGPPGIGKTSLANLILKKYGYNVIEFNASSLRGPKNIREVFDNILEYRSVIDFFSGGKNPTGVIMDEIDTLCNGGDKGGMMEFLSIIKSKKKKNRFNIINPIICTYNEFSDKKIKELITLSVEIKLSKPSTEELMTVVDKIEKEEGLNIDFDAKHILIKHSMGDIRKLIGLLYDIYLINGKKQITLEIVENMLNIFMKKNIDIQIFEMTYNILNKELSSDDIINYYDADKLLLPMMIHENYINSIFNRDICEDDIKKMILECSEILLMNDIYQTSNYDNQTWEIPDTMAYMYCMKINEIAKFKKNVAKHDKINYTMLLNNISNYHKNKKMINNIGSKLKINMSYEDIYYLSEIIVFHLFNKNGNISELIKILQKYNISIENVDLLLKINKLNNTEIKKKYTLKIRNDLKKLLNASEQANEQASEPEQNNDDKETVDDD